MGKAEDRPRGKRKRKENSHLGREINRDIHDGDNMVARVLKVRRKRGGDEFESLKVFPPQWWN
jgi:hypothetical protein